MIPISRTALPRGIKGVKTAVWEVISVPIAIVAAPRGIPHHVGDVGYEFSFFIKQYWQAHAGIERCVGDIEVIVPKLVARFISIRGQVQNKRAALTEALVGSLNQFNGRIHGVARESGHEEKSVLAPCKRFHGLSCEWSVAVRIPIIPTHRAVVSSSKEREFLVKTRFVIAARNTKRYAFGGHEVIQTVGRTAVLQHFKKWRREIGVELVSVDGLPCWSP